MNLVLKQWHANEMEVVLRDTGSSMNGLTSADAKKRLLEYGGNK